MISGHDYRVTGSRWNLCPSTHAHRASDVQCGQVPPLLYRVAAFGRNQAGATPLSKDMAVAILASREKAAV